jgi:GMP reductase
MKIENETKLDYSDVLIRPKRSELISRKDVTLKREFKFKCGMEWTGVPIAAANMDTIGTPEMAKVLSSFDMLTCLCKHTDLKGIRASEEQRWNMAVSFGMNEHSRDILLNRDFRANTLFFSHNFFCLDVSNGYTQTFIDFVKEVRAKWPEKIIIAGNVVTREMTEALLLAGADIIKVGIGPGSVCTTRKMAGVGYPQLSAVAECADAAHGLGGFIMADGGCTCPGDVAKAFGAGADFVMLGGMLSGHTECAGELIEEDGVSYKRFYGMSSDTAMNKHNGGVANYRASEGKTVMVPHRGPVENTVRDILGGIRSACTYVGARRIKDLPKCTTFVKVNRQLNEVFGKS